MVCFEVVHWFVERVKPELFAQKHNGVQFVLESWYVLRYSLNQTFSNSITKPFQCLRCSILANHSSGHSSTCVDCLGLTPFIRCCKLDTISMCRNSNKHKLTSDCMEGGCAIFSDYVIVPSPHVYHARWYTRLNHRNGKRYKQVRET